VYLSIRDFNTAFGIAKRAKEKNIELIEDSGRGEGDSNSKMVVFVQLK